MIGKKYIVVSREGENDATIHSLASVFDGDFRNFSNVFTGIIDATLGIERDLFRRGVESAKASRWAYFLGGCRIGAIHRFPENGMFYRILEADFTSDGKPIVPGLRVLDYDRREGTVRREQFMDEGLMRPGGKYFEGWYDVASDGGGSKGFNGERLRTL